MRILYLNYEWDPRESTGALTHIRELSRGLGALGHTVRVVDRHRIQPVTRPGTGLLQGTADGSSGAGWKTRLKPYLHEGAALLRALRGVAAEAALIREMRPDVVLTRHSLHQFSSILAAWRCGVPVVYEVNAPAAYEYRRYRKHYHLVPGFAEWLEARMLARADGMFVVSSLLRTHFVERGIRPERIRAVPNGADIGRFHPGASDPAVRKLLGEASVIVGFVGSFARFHGTDQLRHAIDVLCRERPEVRFLLVGSGPMSGDLKSHCVREGLDGRVHFTGHVRHREVPALMASADILLAPYAAQEFFYLSPIKIFEYMAVGRAVLAARVGQIAEVLEDGVTGLLYDPTDPGSLSAALLRLVRDPVLRGRLGESARRVVETRYTWQANARAVAGLLEDVVRDQPSRRRLGPSAWPLTQSLRSIRCDLSRVYQEAPAARRRRALTKRLAKVGLALLAHYSGVTGPLLRRLLRSRGAALVLGYHSLRRDVGGLFDSGHAVSHVAGLLRFLSRHLTPLPLEALVGPLALGGDPPAASFAVTFDDGLVNNATLAVPMLKSLGMPATFFVPSGFVGSSRDPWVYSLPEMIRILPGESLPAAQGLWPSLPLGGAPRRYGTLQRLKQMLKAHEGREKEVFSRLTDLAGASPRPPEEDRVVGPEKLMELAQPGLSVGSHSRTHHILSALEPEEAREEIAVSRRELERLVGTEVKDFAYPNGRFGDFTEATRHLVAEAGFRCAVTTEPGVVRRGDDPLALRRCVPENLPVFLTAFEILTSVWRDRDRPADGTRALKERVSHLESSGAEAAA